MELNGTFRRQPLDAIFAPRNVAVIGATENANSVGRTLLWNLISSPFGGTVFPVNPKRTERAGHQGLPRDRDVPEQVDLAVIVTPAPTVPGVIGECVDAASRARSSSPPASRRSAPEGAELEQRVLEQARRGRMRIIGPNCLGVMSPLTGLNATFASGMARPGQRRLHQPERRALHRRARLELREQVGFSAFVSTGSMLDVGWGDLIDYLGNDPHTTEHPHLHGVDRRRARRSSRRRARWR